MMRINFRICLSKTEKMVNQLIRRDMIRLKPVNPGDKNLLLSYITSPFRMDSDNSAFNNHTNMWECLQIAKIWVNYGYNVDVIDWDNNVFIPKKNYQVFIDIHSNMERIAPLLDKDCKKILHITGAHWKFQNEAEMKRLSELKQRKNSLLLPRRQVPPSLGIEYADCATILGNTFAKNTFAYAGKPLFQIPLSTTVTFPFINKNFQKVRNNFVWLGSSGMVHKGLDLVLDAFFHMPDCNLSVCGPVNKEKDFEKLYYNELYHTKNIKTLGFIDVKGKQFLDLINNACGLIYPSCSEGQAGSVITCLHAGLIPVISEQSGVDVNDFGILLKNCSIDEIIESIRNLSHQPEEDLRKMSKDAWIFARTFHTRERFAECYEEFVNNLLQKI